MCDWSELPEEILDLFAQRIPPHAEDFTRFASVCKSFRSVSLHRKQKNSLYGPCLLLPKSSENNTNTTMEDDINATKEGTSIRKFFSISSKQLFSLELPQSQKQGQRCWGSPYGWFVSFGLDRNIHIFNPFTPHCQFLLPPEGAFNYKYINEESWDGVEEDDDDDYDNSLDHYKAFLPKLVLASSPSFWTTLPKRTQFQFCIAIYGEFLRLAFAFPGDDAWTPIETPYPGHYDVIFFGGYIYAVSIQGVLRRCDINTTHPNGIDIASPPTTTVINNLFRFYLVEISGDLYLAMRFGKFMHYCRFTTDFDVYKFDLHQRTWTHISDLGNHALFLGINASFAVLASDFPELNGNCIYFTDDYIYNYEGDVCDMGVYNYVSKTVEPFYFGKDVSSRLASSSFFLPTL